MCLILNAAKHEQQRRLTWKSTHLTYRDLVFLSKLLPIRLDERYTKSQRADRARTSPRPLVSLVLQTPRSSRPEKQAERSGHFPRLTPRFS